MVTTAHMKTLFLFAGQGSQFFGMAQQLFATNAVFREELRNLDDIATGLLGHSIIEMIYRTVHAVGAPFERTLFTHPAVFMIEVALARALGREGVVPDIVLGSSLGELAALVVAGVLAAEDGLEACVAQAEVLEARCAPGGMVAILDDVRIFEGHAWLRLESTLAGVNLARHFVVAAPAARCDAIVKRCHAEGVVCQRLPVRVAFHSEAMDVARDEFLARISKISFSSAKIAMLSSARAGWLTDVSGEFLWELARSPMRFREAIAQLTPVLPCLFVDLSPGGTLSTFVKHSLPPEHRPHNLAVVTAFRNDTERFARVLAEHSLLPRALTRS